MANLLKNSQILAHSPHKFDGFVIDGFASKNTVQGGYRDKE